MQVAEAVHKYAKRTTLTVVPLYGGAPMDQQIRALQRGADVVVATPGRALDHLRRQTLELDALEVLVLDEADEMLDMGFAEDLEAILTATPETRQTALFAATMAPRIASIAERHLKTPERITIKAEKRAAGKLPRMRQVAYIVTRAQKAHALGRVLEFEDPASAIVFCRTRIEVDELTDTLKSHGYGAQALHGGMEQTAARSGDAAVPPGKGRRARGHRRRRARPRHRARLARHQLRHADGARGLRPPHRPHRTHRPRGRGDHARRPARAAHAAQIEGLTKQKIEVVALPTADALRSKRLDITRAALRERLVAGDLDPLRSVVASLAHEFELLDIAAAAVAMIHEDGETAAAAEPLPVVAEEPVGPMTILFVGAGRNAGLRPGDLVGAITGEAHLTSKQIGAIRVGQTHTLVEVPESLADRIITALRRTKLRGQKVDVKRQTKTLAEAVLLSVGPAPKARPGPSWRRPGPAPVSHRRNDLRGHFTIAPVALIWYLAPKSAALAAAPACSFAASCPS